MAQPIILTLVFFTIATILIFIIDRLTPDKGKRSELLVHNNLIKLPPEYYVRDNLLFRSNGTSTQIDHLVVSPYGIFVIETKGYTGWIYGQENAEYWTQNIYGNKYYFYNPIRQNNGHVRFLTYLLRDIGEFPIIPIVVFNNDASLKNNIKEHIVINRCELLFTIKQYHSSIIPEQEILQILNRLDQCNIISKEYTKIHKQRVRKKQEFIEDKLRNDICPWCGGRLVERNGKYGKFYGCSNYPKCRFTIKP